MAAMSSTIDNAWTASTMEIRAPQFPHEMGLNPLPEQFRRAVEFAYNEHLLPDQLKRAVEFAYNGKPRNSTPDDLTATSTFPPLYEPVFLASATPLPQPP
jgi:hypothetical protein